jgi:predicted nucleotidyltransferase
LVPARGDHNPRSDIDIAVIAPNIDQREWLDLCERVEEVDTLLMIDVIRFDTAPDELRQNILREGKVFYERHLPC